MYVGATLTCPISEVGPMKFDEELHANHTKRLEVLQQFLPWPDREQHQDQDQQRDDQMYEVHCRKIVPQNQASLK